MNNQTLGPAYIRRTPGSRGQRAKLSLYPLSERHVSGIPIANVDQHRPEAEANAALLAAAYTSFDKVGRELGVDATLLAQTIDLEEVIRYALDYAQLHSKAHDKQDVGRLDQVQAACRTLSGLAKLMDVELPD